jgi:hypothetical protein
MRRGSRGRAIKDSKTKRSSQRFDELRSDAIELDPLLSVNRRHWAIHTDAIELDPLLSVMVLSTRTT